MTYEQRLHGLALEMAQADDMFAYRMLAEVECNEEGLQRLVNKYLPLARIALKHMAEECKTFFFTDADPEDLESPVLHRVVDGYLQERGLVPAESEQ